MKRIWNECLLLQFWFYLKTQEVVPVKLESDWFLVIAELKSVDGVSTTPINHKAAGTSCPFSPHGHYFLMSTHFKGLAPKMMFKSGEWDFNDSFASSAYVLLLWTQKADFL